MALAHGTIHALSGRGAFVGLHDYPLGVFGQPLAPSLPLKWPCVTPTIQGIFTIQSMTQAMIPIDAISQPGQPLNSSLPKIGLSTTTQSLPAITVNIHDCCED